MEIEKFVEMIKKTEKSLFFGYAIVGNSDEKGNVQLKFDGNNLFTEKYYKSLNNISLQKNDRVLILGKDQDLIIMGVIK